MSERIGSLARLLPAYADVTWQNAATNFLERTLDDSANRRVVLPEALLCADEIVTLARTVVEGMQSRRAANCGEPANLCAVRRHASGHARSASAPAETANSCTKDCAVHRWRLGRRLAAARIIRFHACLQRNATLTALLDPAEIRRLLDPSTQVGTAPQRARLLADRIENFAPFPRQIEVRLS